MKKRGTPAKRSELRAALGSAKAAFIGVGMFSGLINILMLTGSLFMLEVYDRVLPSRSVPTLVGLCDPGGRSVRLPGAARHRARPPAGPHRRPAR